ncbi:MAG: PAS domain S-box protein [Clostridia bacterium]|nr:PAS domain S-box protein [Clostridia bacterium]
MYTRTLGVERSDLMKYQTRVFDAVYPEDRASFRDLLESSKDTSDEFTTELRFRYAGKSLQWLRLRGRRIAKSVDCTVFYIAIEDITNRREMELRLKSENEFCRMLMKTSDVLVFDYSIKADTMSLQYVANEGNLVNLHIDDYIKNDLTCFIYPEDREGVRNLFPNGEYKDDGHFECRIKTPYDNSFPWRRVTYSCIKDESGNKTNVVGQILNIDEQKRREKLLERLNKMLSRGRVYDSDIVSGVFNHMYQVEDTHKAIESILAFLGESYNASRVYIAEYNRESLRCDINFEWLCDGVTSIKDATGGYEFSNEEEMEQSVKRFDRDGIYIAKDISLCAPALKSIFTRLGVRSSVQFAMYNQGELVGFISFDNNASSSLPTREMTGTLLLICQVIGVFIEKNTAQYKISYSEEFIDAIDKNPSLIYIVDSDNFNLIYKNAKVREYLAGVADATCHKVFANKDIPCKGCPLVHYKNTGEIVATQLLRPDGVWVLVQAIPIRWRNRERIMMFSTDITSQKKAEESLHVSDETLALSMEQMGRNICVYHVASHTLKLPEKFAQIWGVASCVNVPEEMIKLLGMDPDSEYTNGYREFFATIDSGQKTGTGEFPFPGRDGRTIWYRFEFVSVFNEAGEPVQAVISFEDTTSYHEENRRLNIEIDRLIAAVRSVYPLTISANLTDNYYNTINREEHPIKRFPMDGEYDMLAESCLRCLRPEDHKAFLDIFSRERLISIYRNGEKSCRAEFVERCDDDVWRWMEIVVLFIDSPYDNDVNCLMLVRGIDKQKSLEEQLRMLLRHTDEELQFQRDYSRVIDDTILAQIIITSSETLEIIHMSGSLFKKYGYSDDEIQKSAQNRLRPFIYPPDFTTATSQMRKVSEQNVSYLEQEYRIIKKDGSLAWVCIGSSLTRSYNGQLLYVSVMTDVTQRRSVELQLLKSDGFMKLASGLYNRVVYRYDVLSGRAIVINPELSEAAGLLSEYDGLPESVIKRGKILPESRDEVLRFFESIHAGESRGYARVRMNLKGENRWYEYNFRSMLDDDGVPVVTAISLLDISDAYEKELAYARYLVDTRTEEINSIGRIDADLTTDVVERQHTLPQGTGDMRGWRFNDAIRYLVRLFLQADDCEAAMSFYTREKLLEKVSAGETGVFGEHFVRYPDGSQHWIAIDIKFVKDPYTGNIKAFGYISDVTEEKTRDMDMRFRAETDQLSGLYNRGASEKYMKQMIDSARPCALIMLDLDDLKSINDTYGHAEGDRTITAIGGVLGTHFRKHDIAGRIGGDEFAVLLTDVSSPEPIKKVLNSLMDKLKSIRVGENDDVGICCSAGVAFTDKDCRDFDALYHRADRALYSVKRAGKGNYAFYSPEMEVDHPH